MLINSPYGVTIFAKDDKHIFCKDSQRENRGWLRLSFIK